MLEQLVSVLDNALLQGLGYGVAVVGVAIAFRVLKYPDLTADGSFLMGASVFGAMLAAGCWWLPAMIAAVAAGAVAGCVTAGLHTTLGVNRLLSGILTAMMCYSIAFWVMSGRSNIQISDTPTMFSVALAAATGTEAGVDATPQAKRAARDARRRQTHLRAVVVLAVIAGLVVAAVYFLLQSDLGIVLRATGENEPLVESLGRHPRRYQTLGLALANGLVGLSGCLIVARQGFTDVNMGFGVIITLVAALVIGEEIVRLARLDPAQSLLGRAASGVLGAFVYFLLYLLIVRASILGWLPVRIQPTDLKLMSALIVVLFVVLRNRSRSSTPESAEVLPI